MYTDSAETSIGGMLVADSPGSISPYPFISSRCAVSIWVVAKWIPELQRCETVTCAPATGMCRRSSNLLIYALSSEPYFFLYIHERGRRHRPLLPIQNQKCVSARPSQRCVEVLTRLLRVGCLTLLMKFKSTPPSRSRLRLRLPRASSPSRRRFRSVQMHQAS